MSEIHTGVGTIIAEVTKDLISADEPNYNQEGRPFTFSALCDWWGWSGGTEIPTSDKIAFQLYDDDGELYYEGWLYNDDECIVQQFVLKWAEVFSGCTTIKVYNREKEQYVKEIG